MKRLIVLLPALMLAGMVSVAMAGDFHYSTSLVCSDCHVMHYSQSHGYTVGGSVFPPLGPGGPHEFLLRDEQNKMCLACHNGQSWAPDVLGDNVTGATRLAGALNVEAGHGLSNDGGYDQIDGHTLFSTALPPGGTGTGYVPSAEGLSCSDCHAVHGDRAYRNLLYRGIFAGDTVSYAVGGTNNLQKDVYERVAATYTYANVDYNEPDITTSRYGNWCQNCHVDFHGKAGDANMGGTGGVWKRHPTGGVDVTGTNLTTRYALLTNKVKAMDSQGLWTGLGTDNTITPSCMSCHKSHGNQNAFGLIFMSGTGTITDNGDGGAFRDMCRQCHTRGNA